MATLSSWSNCVHREHYVLMETLAKNLKERAKHLGISNAEAARRSGLEERAYAHYVANRRDPSIVSLVKIAEKLGTTPNTLLGIDESHLADTQKNELVNRFISAANLMPSDALELCVVQAEAIAALHASKE